jgi:hypothetical protein
MVRSVAANPRSSEGGSVRDAIRAGRELLRVAAFDPAEAHMPQFWTSVVGSGAAAAAGMTAASAAMNLSMGAAGIAYSMQQMFSAGAAFEAAELSDREVAAATAAFATALEGWALTFGIDLHVTEDDGRITGERIAAELLTALAKDESLSIELGSKVGKSLELFG